MSRNLTKLYNQIITPSITSPADYHRFTEKLKHDKLTQKEDPISHFCAMILVYDASFKKILLVFHKKANAWIFPGGHVEHNELPAQTAIREAKEELGLRIEKKELLGPFGAQILDIDNPPQRCREHYDIFYALSTDQSKVLVDMTEFTEYAWVDKEKARGKIELKYYKDALEKFIAFIE